MAVQGKMQPGHLLCGLLSVHLSCQEEEDFT